MRLSSKTRRYIREHQERIDNIPDGATELADQRSYRVGQVYYHIDLDLYIADYTGSDVPEWAIQYYSLANAEDANPTNAQIIEMLTGKAPARPQPTLTLCDCGHYTESPMSASLGSSCPDCYDRMSD